VTKTARPILAVALLLAAAPTASAKPVYRVHVSGSETTHWTFTAPGACDQSGVQTVRFRTNSINYLLWTRPAARRDPRGLATLAHTATVTTEASAEPTTPPPGSDCRVVYGDKCGAETLKKQQIAVDFDKPKAPVLRVGKLSSRATYFFATEQDSDIGKLDCGGPVRLRTVDSARVNAPALARHKRFTIPITGTINRSFNDAVGGAKWRWVVESDLTATFVRVKR
jgi:hypothetical protein